MMKMKPFFPRCDGTHENSMWRKINTKQTRTYETCYTIDLNEKWDECNREYEMKIMRILLRCKMIKESCELYGASVIWAEISWILNFVTNTRIEICTSKNFIRIIVDFCFKIVNILYRIHRRAYKISSLFVLLFCIQINQKSINSQSTKRQSFLKQELKIEIKCEFPSWKLNKKRLIYIFINAHLSVWLQMKTNTPNPLQNQITKDHF